MPQDFSFDSIYIYICVYNVCIQVCCLHARYVCPSMHSAIHYTSIHPFHPVACLSSYLCNFLKIYRGWASGYFRWWSPTRSSGSPRFWVYICLAIYPCVYLSICQFVYLSIYLPIYLSTCFSVCVRIYTHALSIEGFNVYSIVVCSEQLSYSMLHQRGCSAPQALHATPETLSPKP